MSVYVLYAMCRMLTSYFCDAVHTYFCDAVHTYFCDAVNTLIMSPLYKLHSLVGEQIIIVMQLTLIFMM